MSTGVATMNSPLISLSIGIEETIRGWVQAVFGDLENTNIPCDLELLISTDAPKPSVVFCSAPPPEVSLLELAQVVRAQYSEAPIYFLADAKTKFNRAQLMKNGFTDVFFLPIDGSLLERTLTDLRSKYRGDTVAYDSVHLLDLQPGVVLDFDTYILIPSKSKYLKYSAAGDAIDGSRLEKLKSHQVNSLFVARADMPKFYNYAASTLRAINNDPGLSETVRSEKLRGAIREVLSGLFNETVTSTENGRKVVEDCQQIVKAFVKSSPQGTLYEKLLAAVNNSSDTYGHSASVATFASLFGLALGQKDIESLALAGVLHDVGLAMVAPEVQRKAPADWSEDERLAYRKHVEHSIALIQDRKLVLPSLVHKIIRQHHERFDGSGYPEQLPGARISLEAQILAIADAFEEGLSAPTGQKRLSPTEVLQSLNAGAFDPALIKKLLELFGKK